MYSAYKKLSSKLYGTGISKIPFVRSIHKKLISSLAPEIIECNDFRMYHLGSLDQENQDYFNVLKQNIHTGDTVVDIGANIGYYTLLMSNLVGNGGKVFAFEPEPKNFEILQKNLELNQIKNVIVEQKAVSEFSGIGFLELSSDSGQHRISRRKGGGGGDQC